MEGTIGWKGDTLIAHLVLDYERARSESRACRDACGARVDRWMKTTKKGQRVSAVCPTPYTPESVLSEWWLTK